MRSAGQKAGEKPNYTEMVFFPKSHSPVSPAAKHITCQDSISRNFSHSCPRRTKSPCQYLPYLPTCWLSNPISLNLTAASCCWLLPFTYYTGSLCLAHRSHVHNPLSKGVWVMQFLAFWYTPIYSKQKLVTYQANKSLHKFETPKFPGYSLVRIQSTSKLRKDEFKTLSI